MERLFEVVKEQIQPHHLPHAYLIMVGELAVITGMILAEKLRKQIPSLRLVNHCGGGSMKSQFKKADKSGAALALVIGEDEISNNKTTIKYLREDKPQQQLSEQELIALLTNHITGKTSGRVI